VRTALSEAANVILTRPVRGSALKSWAARIATRAGMRKAKVALARRLAVVLHRVLADGAPFAPERAAAAAWGEEASRVGRRGTNRPERGPVAGTMDQARPRGVERRRKDDRASKMGRPAPHRTPSGGGPAPTPDRSQ
jgi:hypothetical protein